MASEPPAVSPPLRPGEPLATVIVVTHNHASYLRACLGGLVQAAQRLPLELIVIDNRSTDASAAIAREFAVDLHVNEQRRGFAANCNHGMALARGRYLMLLNPDTEITTDAIATLIAFIDANRKVGLCGPRVLSPDGSDQHPARRFPTVLSGLARRTPLRAFMRGGAVDRKHLRIEESSIAPRYADWLLGACLVVRREALDRVGPMDEGFRLYVEDIDWARRMGFGDWDVCYVPAACIVHAHQAVSDKRTFSYANWLHTISMLRYIRKHLRYRLPLWSINCSETPVWDATRRALGGQAPGALLGSKGGAASRLPRVLFLHHGAELYGSDAMLCRTVACLAPYVEPIIILDSGGPLVDRLRAITPQVHIRRLGVLRRRLLTPWGVVTFGIATLAAAVRLAVGIRREQVALVYTNTGAIACGALAARLTRRPHVWHIHEIVAQPPWFARGWARVIVRHAARVVAVSAAVRDALLRHAPEGAPRMAVVHNAVAIAPADAGQAEVIRAEFAIAPGAFVIALIGRIHFWKGQDFLLRAAGILRQQGLNAFRVLIVGDVFPGYEEHLRDLKNQVRQAGLVDQVTFTGYRHDVAGILAAADVVVVPSVQPEPFGLVTLEAMTCGVPVVATRLGASPELVADGETGYLVSASDPAEMAQRLLELARDEGRRQAMGVAARRRAQQHFAPEAFSRDLLQAVLPLLHAGNEGVRSS